MVAGLAAGALGFATTVVVIAAGVFAAVVVVLAAGVFGAVAAVVDGVTIVA